MKRPYICFCPFCGSDKVSEEQFRNRCYSCGRLFSVKELPLLRVTPFDYDPAPDSVSPIRPDLGDAEDEL